MTSFSQRSVFTPAEIVGACEAAAAAGDTDYSRVFSIAHSGRSAGAAHYVDLTARVGSKEGRLWLKFVDEKLSGKIAPLPGMGDPGAWTRDPTRPPTLGIQKWSSRVDPDGPEPPEESRSRYFQALECIEHFFMGEIARRLEAGEVAVKGAKGSKAAGALVVMNANIVPLYQTHVSHRPRSAPARPSTTRLRASQSSLTKTGLLAEASKPST